MLQEIYTVVSHFLDLITNPQQDINDTAESNQILTTGFLQIGGTMGVQRITIGGKNGYFILTLHTSLSVFYSRNSDRRHCSEQKPTHYNTTSQTNTLILFLIYIFYSTIIQSLPSDEKNNESPNVL
jgi:hypothetical protein